MDQLLFITPTLTVILVLTLFLAPVILRPSPAPQRILDTVGTLTGWILSTLPVVLLVLTDVINPGYSKAFLHALLGLKLLYTCMGMSMIGALVIHRIANRIEV
jgi:hypothetical protein